MRNFSFQKKILNIEKTLNLEKPQYRNQTKRNIENQRENETKRIKRKHDDESFELSKMAYVESYGGLGQDLQEICRFQNTRVPGSPKKSPHQIAVAEQTGFLVFKYFKLRRP